MSVQETNLRAIADAIREKDGTTEPIPADTFPNRIRAIPAGGMPENMFTIAVESSNPEMGTVSGGGMVSNGMRVTATIEAIPSEGNQFVAWQENGETVSDNAEYTFTVSGNRDLAAVFEEIGKYIPGADWWETTLPSSAYWKSVAYGDGKFVALAYVGGGKAAYSTDGVNWAAATISD